MIYLEGALKICRFGMVVKILVNSLLYGILISCVVILFVFKEEETNRRKRRKSGRRECAWIVAILVRLSACGVSRDKLLGPFIISISRDCEIFLADSKPSVLDLFKLL